MREVSNPTGTLVALHGGGTDPDRNFARFGAESAADTWAETKKAPVPIYAFIGEENGGLQRCLATTSVLERAGVPIRVEVQEGIGHELPWRPGPRNGGRAGVDDVSVRAMNSIARC